MACMYYDDCKNASNWCKKGDSITKCLIGLNRRVSELNDELAKSKTNAASSEKPAKAKKAVK